MNARHWLVLTVGLAFAAKPVLADPPMVPLRIHVDSQSDGDAGVKALDGDPNTFWHTFFGDGETKHPDERS